MALKRFDPCDASAKRERIIIYGEPGVGKTRLALSLPERFGDILYFAADDNSQFLDSISPAKRKRVVVMVPSGDDPLMNFQEFCHHDWKAEFPEVETIVVDTYTTVTEKCLQSCANSGCVTAEKHFEVGDRNNGGQVIPNRGDYLGLESLSRGFLDTLFDIQSNMHIIFVQHVMVRDIEGTVAQGGPAHPGRKMLKEIPARFSTVIRLVKDEILKPGDNTPESVVIAITDNDGKYIAKARTEDEDNPSPLGRVVLDRNSENFWALYDDIYAPKEVVTRGKRK